MRAAVRSEYGITGVVRVEDGVPVPEPSAGEVRVRVHAAGVDPGVWHLMAGLPLLVRLAIGLRAPRFHGLGMDLAGVVDAVAPDVTAFQPGDEVFGVGRGTFAEYAIAKAAKLAHRPDAVPVESAAVLSISGLTALQAVRDVGAIQEGQRVLVLGAAGGVGSYAVQIAASLGGVVTGVASGGKRDAVLALGAREFVDYTAGEPQGRWDLVIDTAGNRSLKSTRSMLAPHGTLVIVGGEGGGRLLGGLDRNLAVAAAAPWTPQHLRTFISRENAADLAVLGEMVSSERVRPLIGARYPLERAGDAIDHVHAGHATGKTLLTVG